MAMTAIADPVPKAYAQLEPIDLVASKLAKLEAMRGRMRKVSTMVRNRNAVGLKRLGFGQSKVARLMQPANESRCEFYADNQVRNQYQQINALRRAARALEEHHKEDARIGQNGYEYREDTGNGRVIFRFAAKPNKALRALLRRAGFVLGANRNTYERTMDGEAPAAAYRISEHLNRDKH
jgi:hypothetical protein